jgi:hypothetical protein
MFVEARSELPLKGTISDPATGDGFERQKASLLLTATYDINS